MADEILRVVEVNFVLIVGMLLLLVIILFLIIRTKKQIMNISIDHIPTPVSEPQSQQPQPEIINKTQPPPVALIPQPPKQPKQIETFKCKKCNKEFNDKKKLQRHIGMAHYQDLEI